MDVQPCGIPSQSLSALFVRFLRFGCLAWGGPVAQITMIKRELVDEERSPSLPVLFGSGLRSGLLTFGGAYTVIPYLQHDAVRVGAWMTDAQFLDGLALSGILPAPLIIFATFVGYLGAAAAGAIVLTIGIFLPAFGFTLVGHELFERVTGSDDFRTFLAGVTAGVIGLIIVTGLNLGVVAIDGWVNATIGLGCFILLWRWNAKAAVVVVLGVAGLAAYLLQSVA